MRLSEEEREEKNSDLGVRRKKDGYIQDPSQ